MNIRARQALVAFFFGAALMFFAPNLYAATQVEGRATLPFTTGLFSSTPDPTVRQRAIADAEKNALDRYASGFSQAKSALFQKVSDQVYKQLDQYVINSLVVDEGVDQNHENISRRGSRHDKRRAVGCIAE